MNTQPIVRASELTGRGWLNTGGEQLNLASLRGKILILDFWTFCCINCLHVIDELRPVEEKYSEVLVTIGVHSPKFEHEADPEALLAAVERYQIHHPVLDDPDLNTWQAYTARAWPTLVVIDPEGYIVAHLSGEGHAAGLDSLIDELVAKHEAKGTLHRGDGPYVPPEPVARTLRFPGKALPLENGSILVSDTGHHQLVILDADLETELGRIGSGERGWADGEPSQAKFNEPQGATLLPQELRQKLGFDVVLADTVNHRLRTITLSTGKVGTLAGNGIQRLLDAGPGALNLDAEGPEVSLSSPWDIVWDKDRGELVVAMAGTHQIFAVDPVTSRVRILAGTGDEGLLDARAAEAWFAQSSGLALDTTGVIWVADSETSAIRKLAKDSSVSTALGVGLFDFGFRDGAAEQARAQHPLGVCVLPDSSVAFADTYNSAVRRFDPVSGQVSTLAQGLAEPSDLFVDPADPSLLVVVETNAHRLVRVPIPAEAQSIDRGEGHTQRPTTVVKAGAFSVISEFVAPRGQKLDFRFGDPTQLKISSTPEELIISGAGTSQGLERQLVLNPEVAEGVLHITARAAACDGEEGQEIPLHAACHLYQQDWGIPVEIAETGDQQLKLHLRGA